MARLAFSLSIVGLLAACTQEVDDPSFNTAGEVGSDTSGSSGSSSGGDDSQSGSASMTSSSSSTTSNSTTASDESTSGGSSGGVDSTASATTGASGCGDGMISPGEQCDGADLQGFDCTSLGLSGGTLSCDPVTCTFDTSMCMSTTGGTSG